MRLQNDHQPVHTRSRRAQPGTQDRRHLPQDPGRGSPKARNNQPGSRPKAVKELLGHPIFLETEEIDTRTSIPGVVPGLAWTPFGGDILFIEATRMPGAKGFQVTGSVGNVMQELARAALSYVRSHAVEIGLQKDFFDKSDIHLHIPAGAQPKDGPSAGVTMATALVSLISGRPVKKGVSMTGEITLRGQVMPVGGIKEKMLAAHRAGRLEDDHPAQTQPAGCGGCARRGAQSTDLCLCRVGE